MPSVMVTYAALLSTALLPSSSGLCSHPGRSSNSLSIHSHRNESGHWIITVDTVNTGREDGASRLSAIDIEQVTVNCDDEERMHLQTIAQMRVLDGDGGVTNTSGRTHKSPGEQTTPTSRPATTTQGAAPGGYERFPGISHYYKFHPEEVTWYTARTTCQQEGADLMVISSHQELSLARTLYLTKRRTFFIGLHNRNAGGKFYTVKGDLVDGSKYSHWHNGHNVSVAGESCAVFDSDGMCERGCSATLAFVCQFDG